MSYQLFLKTLAELSSMGTASIALEHGTIHIRSHSGNNRWSISMPLLQDEEGIPAYVCSSVSSTGRLRIEQAGPYIELESSTQTLSLIDEIVIDKDAYVSFKKQLLAFIERAKEWQEVFEALK